MKFIRVYKLKKILKLTLFFISLFILLFLSKENFESVKNSVTIFISSVLPSLFPFIFFTEIILNTDIINILSRIFGNIISKLFKVSKNSATAVIIGFLCGYPMGSKTVSTLYSDKKISRDDANILLTFVNNCNPAFILSTIAIGVFYNMNIGIILLISHVLSSILIGIMYSRKYYSNIIHKKDKKLNSFGKKSIINENINYNNNSKDLSFFEIIKKSIFNAFLTLSNIFGFIIIFNLLFSIFAVFLQKINIPNFYITILSGIFEITSGCHNIGILNIDIIPKLCITSFILGFSGLCINAQIFSTISKQKFKFFSLIKSKLLHGILSCIITYILLRYTNMHDLSTISVFSNTETITKTNYIENMKIAYLSTTFIIIAGLFIFFCIRKLYFRKSKK